MKKFVYVIGSVDNLGSDDFDSLQDLEDTYHRDPVDLEGRNGTTVHYEISENTRVTGLDSLEEVVRYLGRGEVSSRGWSIEGSVDTVIELG